MPVYTLCPHCGHPMVVPATARGKGRLCKQCGQGYRVSKSHTATLPLAAHSAADLARISGRASGPAFVIL